MFVAFYVLLIFVFNFVFAVHIQRHDSCMHAATFYASCMDTDAVDKLGAAPMQPLFDEITALQDEPGLMGRVFARLSRRGIGTPLALGVYPDAQRPTHNTAYVSQS